MAGLPCPPSDGQDNRWASEFQEQWDRLMDAWQVGTRKDTEIVKKAAVLVTLRSEQPHVEQQLQRDREELDAERRRLQQRVADLTMQSQVWMLPTQDRLHGRGCLTIAAAYVRQRVRCPWVGRAARRCSPALCQKVNAATQQHHAPTHSEPGSLSAPQPAQPLPLYGDESVAHTTYQDTQEQLLSWVEKKRVSPVSPPKDQGQSHYGT